MENNKSARDALVRSRLGGIVEHKERVWRAPMHVLEVDPRRLTSSKVFKLKRQ